MENQNRRIMLTVFEAGNILLTEARPLSQLLLRQVFFLSEAGSVAARKFAHVHAKHMAMSQRAIYQL